MKTIKMRKELGEKWLAALRSDKYKQGFGTLECDGRYCCLGVLEHVADGSTETEALPSYHWLHEHNVCFSSSIGATVTAPYVETSDGFECVANLNDEGMPFSDIADLLEKHMEFIE